MTSAFWAGKRVLVTGHSGFKGAWLCLWLRQLGAHVGGLSLPVAERPNLFELTALGGEIESIWGDIRDYATVAAAFDRLRPEVVFHLAAQSLVGEGYRTPSETYATNLLGTVHMLEALRHGEGVRAAVMVTSDKCYEQPGGEGGRPFREGDRLGGRDPYSNSKACAELAVQCYRDSFLRHQGVALATARAGNVIGGGDWSRDRLVPDVVRALHAGEPAHIRHPRAVRPWQHVLEPLSGYLLLAECLADANAVVDAAAAWNFGPDPESTCTVGELTARLVNAWGEGSWQAVAADPLVHEAAHLRLDSSLSRARLGWQPRWTLDDAVHATMAWYCAWAQGADLRAVMRQQVQLYEATPVAVVAAAPQAAATGG